MKKFFAGVVVHASILSLSQDMMGREQYLKYVEAAWLSSTYTVPLAILGIMAGFALYKSNTLE